MSARMYIKGNRIESLDELMRQPLVIHMALFNRGFQKVYHRGWFSSWSLKLAQDWIKMGSLYTAEKKVV